MLSREAIPKCAEKRRRSGGVRRNEQHHEHTFYMWSDELPPRMSKLTGRVWIPVHRHATTRNSCLREDVGPVRSMISEWIRLEDLALFEGSRLVVPVIGQSTDPLHRNMIMMEESQTRIWKQKTESTEPASVGRSEDEVNLGRRPLPITAAV